MSMLQITTYDSIAFTKLNAKSTKNIQVWHDRLILQKEIF